MSLASRAPFLSFVLLVLAVAGGCGGSALPAPVDGGAAQAVSARRVWLPSARVGSPYALPLPAEIGGRDARVVDGAWPAGLAIDRDGVLGGQPTRAGHATVTIVDSEGPSTIAELTVFAAAPDGGSVDERAKAPVPFAVGLREATFRSTSSPSRRVRLLYPAAGGPAGAPPRANAAPAAGRHPLIVFQHGAGAVTAAHPTLFDRYDGLLAAWASWGFVVASVDGTDHVIDHGELLASTIEDVEAMSRDGRDLLAAVRAPGGDGALGLPGAIDATRVVAAGHSRGGAAALLTAAADPAIVGSLLVKPMDPLTAGGGEDGWSRALPDKPMLIVLAGSDGELPGPMVSYLYERRSAPAVAVDVVGSVHAFSADADWAVEANATPGIDRTVDWAVTNAWARAFLDWAVRGDVDAAVALFGAGGLSTSLSPQGVLVESDAAFAGLLVDDFSQLADPMDASQDRNALGEPTESTGLSVSVDEPTVDDDRAAVPGGADAFARWYETPEARRRTSAHRLEGTSEGGRYVEELGGVDARAWPTFVLRARTPRGGMMRASDVGVTFVDTAGRSLTMSLAAHTGAAAFAERFSNVIVPMSLVAAAGVDCGALAHVQLTLGGAGTLIIDDLRFE